MPVATSHGFGAYETTADETWTGVVLTSWTKRAHGSIQSTVALMGMLQLEMDTIKVILESYYNEKSCLLITVRAMEARPYQV
jgi:hypothetical protein